MRVLILSLLATTISLCFQSSAENTNLTEPQPDWVTEQSIPSMPEARLTAVQNGIGYLLSDNQLKWDGESHEYFNRLAYEVTDRNGLEEAARITPSYDPEDTTLAFSRLDVIRNGERIDRLSETRIDIIQQEEEMDAGILDGTLTAVIQLEDIRVGDVIDYAYHGRVESPLWPGEFFSAQSVEWAVPLVSQTFRILVPERHPLTVTKTGTELPVTSRRQDNQIEYSFSISDPEPVPAEKNMAYGSVPYGYVSFSSMEDWSELVEWALPLYDVQHDLPDEFAARIDALRHEYPAKEDQIVHALRLVQDEIRYLGIQSGLGSHKPRPPEVTLARGYGDCKDKTLLLAVILQRLGIDARPALANVYDGFAIDSGPVVVGAFNHVIVHVRLNGQDYWLDPTLSHQGGSLTTLVAPDYGYVLPIRPETTTLKFIDLPFPEDIQSQVVETFSLISNGDTFDQARLGVQTRYLGAEADSFRRRLADGGIEAISRKFLDYYAEYYPGIEQQDQITVSDDLDTNEILITEAYKIPPDAFADMEFGDTLPVRATAVLGELPAKIEANRRIDLWLPYGTHARHVIRAHVPGKLISPPENVSLSAHGVTVDQTYTAESEWLTIDYTLKVKERSAKAEHAQDIIQLKNDLDDIGYLELYPDKASPTFARRLGLEEPLPAETEAAFSEVSKLYSNKQYAEAQEILSGLLASHTDSNRVRGYTQLLRAVVFEAQNRPRASIPAYREAFELMTPQWPSNYFSYADMIREDDPVETAAIIEKLLTEMPEEIGNLSEEWLWRLLRDLEDDSAFEAHDSLLIAAAKAQHANSTGADQDRALYAAAIEPLIKANDIETASTLVAEVNDPEMLALLLSKRASEPVWDIIESKFGSDLSIALDRFVDKSKAEADAEESDFRIQARYLNALRQAGAYDEAMEHGEAVTSNWARIEAVGEEAYWFVNEYAYALADSGRVDEAIATFDRILDFGIEENPNLISMAINRAHVLLTAGRYERAIEASTALESLGDEYASEFGKAFILSAKLCATSQLGRTEEAQSIFDNEFAPIAEENPSAHMQVLLCLADREAAAELLVDRLDEQKTRNGAIYTFVSTDGTGDVPEFTQMLRKRIAAVQNAPEVRSAFSPIGREITISGNATYWANF